MSDRTESPDRAREELTSFDVQAHLEERPLKDVKQLRGSHLLDGKFISPRQAVELFPPLCVNGRSLAPPKLS